jgi:hypothetical protein
MVGAIAMQRLTRDQLIARYEPIFEDITREIKDRSREKYLELNVDLQEKLFFHFLVMARRHDLIARDLADAIIGGVYDTAAEFNALPLAQWFDASALERKKTPALKLVEGVEQDAGLVPGRTFLNDEKLYKVQNLRKEGKWEKAEVMLLEADPTPAVLDEFRKLCSIRAWAAKKEGDWQAVVQYLERYSAYASEWEDWCLKTVNQAPPAHTAKDQKLLEQARVWVSGQ